MRVRAGRKVATFSATFPRRLREVFIQGLRVESVSYDLIVEGEEERLSLAWHAPFEDRITGS
jgi:hypothetical protein